MKWKISQKYMHVCILYTPLIEITFLLFPTACELNTVGLRVLAVIVI